MENQQKEEKRFIKPEYSKLVNYSNHKLTIIHNTPFYLKPIKPTKMSAEDLVKEKLGTTKMARDVEDYYYVPFKDLDTNEIGARVSHYFNKEDGSIEDRIPIILEEAREQHEIYSIKAEVEDGKLKVLGHLPRKIPLENRK